LFDAGQRHPAPALTGELLDGGRFDLGQHRGDVVVINFWASWCSPCRAEASELVAVADATKAQRVSFVGIDIRDDRDKAKAFVEGHAISYPSLFDPAGRSALDFADVPPTATPSTLIVDRKGRIAALYTRALVREELEQAVRSVAAEPN
jgi:thiol-disulfide isomerase/thioredoxin